MKTYYRAEARFDNKGDWLYLYDAELLGEVEEYVKSSIKTGKGNTYSESYRYRIVKVTEEVVK